jgi:nitrogen-specific signal transduction histidine kinase/CheY-like chemotaxis protein
MQKSPSRNSEVETCDRNSLQAQLFQAQKMDAIGQFAAAIAHDFNNALLVITSYAELGLEALSREHPVHHKLQEILKASRRAAGLTRQLLTFSREQAQSVQELDLNALLQDLGRMLPCLPGEDVEFLLFTSKGQAGVKADPVQMEQVIMNLAANARDAMPNGGRFTIETSIVAVDEAFVQHWPALSSGEYVLITVSDSGQGIAAEHLSRIFEPFFTTKRPGRGTGLGLATVYAIIQRSAGDISVYSEPGLGTTFKIYLPRAASTMTASTAPSRDEQQRGSATVLVVEDEESVRSPACEYLTRCGYHILQAPDGQEALVRAASFHGHIDLLVTDVVMPHMNGPELAEKLSRDRPGLPVLYISGYADPTLMKHGFHRDGAKFLQKPYTLKILAAKVREALTSSFPKQNTPIGS